MTQPENRKIEFRITGYSPEERASWNEWVQLWIHLHQPQDGHYAVADALFGIVLWI